MPSSTGTLRAGVHAPWCFLAPAAGAVLFVRTMVVAPRYDLLRRAAGACG